MDWKKFLKPDWRKIVLTCILTLVLSIFFLSVSVYYESPFLILIVPGVFIINLFEGTFLRVISYIAMNLVYYYVLSSYVIESVKKFKPTLKKIIIYSILLGFIFNFISTIHQKSTPCGPGCWGGSVQWGFPFLWYTYTMGGVITGTEWMRGTISWYMLILNIVFWSIMLFVILYMFSIVKSKAKNMSL